MQNNLSETLKKQHETLEKLKAFGVNPERAPEIIQLIQEQNLHEDALKEHRKEQFWDDAGILNSQLPGGRGSMSTRLEIISEFLREFAEHVAGHVIGKDQWIPKDESGSTVTDIVDRIPAMNGEDRTE